MNNPEGFEFLDSNAQLHFDADDKAIRKLTQEIPDSFLDNLRDKRFDSVRAPAGDMHHVASIPVSIVERWMAEGFNIYDKNVKLRDIIRRLNREDMDGLMATTKSVI